MKKAAPFLVLCAASLWGCIGIFVRILSSYGFTSWQITELRCVFTALIVVVAVALWRPSLLRIHPRDVWCFIGTGVLSVLFFNWCYFTTIQLTSLSVAAVLLYTAPVFVTLFSRFLFKETITARKVTALILALGGCVLVSGVITRDTTLSALGILVGLGSGLGYSLYSIFSRFALKRGYHPFTITAWTFIVAAIAGAFVTDFGSIVTVCQTRPEVLLVLFLSSLLCAAIPYMLYTVGLSHMDTGAASIIATFEPVMATIMGIFVFKEVPTVSGMAGMALVLTAVILLRPRGNAREVSKQAEMGNALVEQQKSHKDPGAGEKKEGNR